MNKINKINKYDIVFVKFGAIYKPFMMIEFYATYDAAYEIWDYISIACDDMIPHRGYFRVDDERSIIVKYCGE